jgi:hypothetical protein
VSHVLEHVPATGGNPECCKVAQINAFLSASAKDVHGVIYEGGRMAFAGHGDVANAVELRPRVGAWLIGPDIVEPRDAVCTTETENNQPIGLCARQEIGIRTDRACHSTSPRNDWCGLAVICPEEKPVPWCLVATLPTDLPKTATS